MRKNMKLSILIGILSLMVLVKAHAKKINYDSLIKDIYDEHGTAGVIVATYDQRAMDRLTIVYETCRMLSHEGIPSIMVNFKKFKERLTFYVQTNFHTLVVILFHGMEQVRIFEKMTTDGTMGDSIWLILFLGRSGKEMCDYCRKPYGNLLNLRFDSQVFVSCCESDIIEEWWSSKVNSTKKQEIGRWINEDRRIEWFVKKDLYSRRNSLEGRELRIAASKGSTYIWEKDGKYYGFFGEILNELALTMNFTIPKLIWEGGYGSFDTKTSKWSGVIGKLQRNEADIGVSPFCMSDERLNAVDYTIPMAVGESRLYMKKLDGARVQWKAYFKAFAMDAWMVIIGMILIMPLFLTLINYRRNDHSSSFVIEHYLCVLGIYCQQGLSKFPKATSFRILYVSIFISALFIANIYSASLISFLTVFSSHSPFNTLGEFARDGTYKLIVVKDSVQYHTYKNSNETLRMRLMSLMKPKDALPRCLTEGFNHVCNERVAFETNEALRKTMTQSICCELTSIGTGTIETFGMITPRRSEYLPLINYGIRQFKSNGVFERLEKKYFRVDLRKKIDYTKVSIEGIKPILYTFAIGFIITLIIFIIEIFFNSFPIILRKWRMRKMIKKKILNIRLLPSRL